MLKLKDERTELYQWDTNRFVTVDGECSELHFSNRNIAKSIPVEVVNGEARIPDELLQSSNPLKVWGFVGSVDNGFTKFEESFEVKPKKRPTDYVYTPTEVKSFKDLKEKLDGMTSEKWVFELENGETIEKQVVVEC